MKSLLRKNHRRRMSVRRRPRVGPAPKGRRRGPAGKPETPASAEAAKSNAKADTETVTAMPSTDAEANKKSRNEEVEFHGQKRTNATHVSTTDPEARLFRKGKGKEAKLCYIGPSTSENRHGLIVETEMTQATGTAEREAAKSMIESHAPGSQRKLTVGADKAYERPTSR